MRLAMRGINRGIGSGFGNRYDRFVARRRMRGQCLCRCRHGDVRVFAGEVFRIRHLGEFPILIARQCIAIRAVTTIAVTTTTTATTTWRVITILDSRAFSLW